MKLRAAIALVLLTLGSSRLAAQIINPVYVDDSPIAEQTLAQAKSLVATGNSRQAARSLAELLRTAPDKLVPTETDHALYVSVRDRVHAELLNDPALLREYQDAEEVRAGAVLADQGVDPILAAREVERIAFLTHSGFEASLRLARVRLESAQFDAAQRTLQQLSVHPSRSDQGFAQRAADLAVWLRRYDPSDPTTELASTWNRLAGRPDPEAPPILPTGQRRPLASVREGAAHTGPSEFQGVETLPLWSRPFVPPGAARSYSIETVQSNARDRSNSALWVQPTVAGDAVYVNDGVVIRALDRLTLDPLWEVIPPHVARFSGFEHAAVWQDRMFPDKLRGELEDVSSVAVASGVVVTVTGIAAGGERRGDPRVHGLDTQTGQVLWSVDISRLADATADYIPKGPPLISGRTAIIPVRRQTSARRVSTFALVGLDLATGKSEWFRPIASAGSIFAVGSSRSFADAPVLRDGVVYARDSIGAVAAIEAHTGAPIWVRKIETPDLGNASGIESPWEYAEPVLLGRELFTLSPSRREILRLSADTGALLSSLNGSRFDYPRYLLACGTTLVTVNASSVSATPVADVVRGKPVSVDLGVSRPVGRVVVVGDRLLVPTETGYLVADPAGVEATTFATLKRPGTIVPALDQVLVVDDAQIHSYIEDRTADLVLRERMRNNPDDPRHAIAYAGFAWRTDRLERVLEAVTYAEAALSRAEVGSGFGSERQHLLDQLLEIAASALSTGRADRVRLEALVPIMHSVARAPAQIAAVLLVDGAYSESKGRSTQALEAYHKLLAEPAIANSPYLDEGSSTLAGLEAAHRVRQMVRELGPSSYAPFVRRGDEARASLGPAPTAQELESLARRFPPIAAPYLLEAALLHEAAGARTAALTALTDAVIAADCAAQGGLEARHAPLELAAGLLVDALVERGQYATAASLARRLSRSNPSLRLVIAGTSRTAGEWADAIARDLRSNASFPALGTAFAGTPQIIRDAYTLSPVSRDLRTQASEYVVLLRRGESRVALWGLPGFVPDAAPAELVELWSSPYTGDEPTLLRTPPDHAIFSHHTAGGLVLERVDVVEGRTRWKTEAFSSLFPPDPVFHKRVYGADDEPDRRATPADSSVSLIAHLVAFGDNSITVFERSGRLAVFDSDTGKHTETAILPVDIIYDADMDDVTIAVAADVPDDQTDRPVLLLKAVGAPLRDTRRVALDAPPKWVRFIAPGRLLLGYDNALVCVDTDAGAVAWTATELSADSVREVWDFGDRLYVLSSQGETRVLDALTGSAAGTPTTVTKRLGIYSRIDAVQTEQGVLFSSASGAVLLDRTGNPVGADALRASGTLLPALPTRDGVVVVDSRSRSDSQGRRTVRVNHLSAESLAVLQVSEILLASDPIDAVALQGHLVLTAAGSTIVLQMPAER